MAAIVAVAAAAAASAWNTHRNGLVWDDRAAIVSNKDVRGTRALYEAFTHDFWGTPIRSADSHKSYRPLTVLSFRLNHALAGGVHAHHFHATNALVHVGNALLVWRVARALFRKFEPSDSDISSAFTHLGALLAALVFAVHPIHSDAIASIVGRADLLCTLLSLLAFYLYMRAVELPAHTNWRAFVLALVCAVAASLCKELGFTTLGLFLAYDAVLQRSLRTRQRLVTAATTALPTDDAHCEQTAAAAAFHRRALALVMSTLALTAMRVWINGEHRQMRWNIQANSVAVQRSQLTRMLSYAHIHAWYLWKLVWPRTLCFDYGFKTVPLVTSLYDVHNLYTLAAYSAVAVGVVVGWRHVATSPLLMSIAFGVIPFVPASNLLFPVGTVVAERLLYMPSVGFCLLAGHMLQAALRIAYTHGTTHLSSSDRCRAPPQAYFRWCYSLTVLCTAVVLASGCYRTQLRNAEWIDEPTLFRAALSVSPTNSKVLSNLSKTLLGRDNARAIELARRAVAIVPQQAEGHTNLGLAHWRRNEGLFAVRHLIKAAHFGRNGFQGKGSAGSALLDHWMAEHSVSTSTVHTVRRAFLGSPTVRAARTMLDAAIAAGSFQPVHYYTRARLAYMAGEFDDAVVFGTDALHLNAVVLTKSIDSELHMYSGQIHNLVAIAHVGAGRQQAALAVLATGLAAAPHDPDMLANTASLLAEANDVAGATHYMAKLLAVATQPKMIAALELVARAMRNVSKLHEAAECEQRATQLRFGTFSAASATVDAAAAAEEYLPLSI